MISTEQLAKGYDLLQHLWRPDIVRPLRAGEVVRENLLLKGVRVLLQLHTRRFMNWYHQLSAIGTEHFLDNRPGIITPNHSSHLDTLAIFSSLPVSQVNTTYSGAAKDYFFRNGFLSLVARLMANGIPIDRNGTSGSGIRLCARKLEAGQSLIMFPEGTRTRTGRIGRFRPGAITLSRRVRVPIVPTYIGGTFESMGRAMYFPRRRPISVIFGEPMRFWESPLADLEGLEAAQFLEERVRALKQELESGGAGK